jgi:hypothetical protein
MNCLTAATVAAQFTRLLQKILNGDAAANRHP